jgi:hypothetical protein
MGQGPSHMALHEGMEGAHGTALTSHGMGGAHRPRGADADAAVTVRLFCFACHLPHCSAVPSPACTTCMLLLQGAIAQHVASTCSVCA